MRIRRRSFSRWRTRGRGRPRGAADFPEGTLLPAIGTESFQKVRAQTQLVTPAAWSSWSPMVLTSGEMTPWHCVSEVNGAMAKL